MYCQRCGANGLWTQLYRVSAEAPFGKWWCGECTSLRLPELWATLDEETTIKNKVLLDKQKPKKWGQHSN